MAANSASATNLDSQETARQFHADPAMYKADVKDVVSAGPPPGVGNPADRMKLAQIENAIDCLLAQ